MTVLHFPFFLAKVTRILYAEQKLIHIIDHIFTILVIITKGKCIINSKTNRAVDIY